MGEGAQPVARFSMPRRWQSFCRVGHLTLWLNLLLGQTEDPNNETQNLSLPTLFTGSQFSLLQGVTGTLLSIDHSFLFQTLPLGCGDFSPPPLGGTIEELGWGLLSPLVSIPETLYHRLLAALKAQITLLFPLRPSVYSPVQSDDFTVKSVIMEMLTQAKHQQHGQHFNSNWSFTVNSKHSRPPVSSYSWETSLNLPHYSLSNAAFSRRKLQRLLTLPVTGSCETWYYVRKTQVEGPAPGQ